MNWGYVYSVWALDWCPRKLSLGAQTLCIISTLMLSAPALATTSAATSSPLEGAASCTQLTEVLSAVQRQAADMSAVRYLLAEVLRTLEDLKTGQSSAAGGGKVLATPPESGVR